MRRSRHLRSFLLLLPLRFTPARLALTISEARIRQPPNPAKLYFGAKAAIALPLCRTPEGDDGMPALRARGKGSQRPASIFARRLQARRPSARAAIEQLVCSPYPT